MASAFWMKQKGKRVLGYKHRGADGKWVGPLRAKGCRTLEQAQRLADDRERQAERHRHGLEALPGEGKLTFGDLFKAWWKGEGSRRRSESKFEFKALVERHLQPLWSFVLNAATAPAFAQQLQALLDGKHDRSELAPQTLNHLRAGAFAAFRHARSPISQLWKFDNPVQWVKRYRVPKGHRITLKLEQFMPVLMAFREPRLGAPWRWVAAVCLYLALRPGEAMGLWKAHVDTVKWVIYVQRSWSSPFPKDNDPRPVAVPTVLRPFLMAAMQSSPNHLVFPTLAGKVFKPSTRRILVKKLRAAAASAGIVDGYLHTCRRCRRKVEASAAGAPSTFAWMHEDGEQRRCPTCSMKLWISPVPKRIRFYDLRHTNITVLLDAGVAMDGVQLQAGHAESRTTKAYDHSDPLRFRDQMDRVLMGSEVPVAVNPATAATGLTTGSPQPVTPPAAGAPDADPASPAFQQIPPVSKR
ncbi:MAG: site-specific integrase [Anaeromyxobacteraceae bacterium]